MSGTSLGNAALPLLCEEEPAFRQALWNRKSSLPCCASSQDHELLARGWHLVPSSPRHPCWVLASFLIILPLPEEPVESEDL